MLYRRSNGGFKGFLEPFQINSRGFFETLQAISGKFQLVAGVLQGFLVSIS